MRRSRPVACEMVQALNIMSTRSINVFEPAVVTVGRITAGTTNNVIPEVEVAEVEGTIRSTSDSTRRNVHDDIRRVASGIGDAHGCDIDVALDVGYPITSNDDRFGEFALDLAGEVANIGDGHAILLPHPMMGAEDFSYVLNEVPGQWCSSADPPQSYDLRTAAPNHSNRVFFEEAAMTTGTALYTMAALLQLSPI